MVTTCPTACEKIKDYCHFHSLMVIASVPLLPVQDDDNIVQHMHTGHMNSGIRTIEDLEHLAANTEEP